MYLRENSFITIAVLRRIVEGGRGMDYGINSFITLAVLRGIVEVKMLK